MGYDVFKFGALYLDFNIQHIPQYNARDSFQNGSQVKMYTFTENNRPVNIDEQVKNVSQLILTDHYFGDEYLVPWTISNGVAVASQALFKQEEKRRFFNGL